ncbi:polysaccharide deacetylase family protein [Aromatoleum petrolei]|uniref:Polysaccharide deacetylase family protein n=2 Tax=Aromatoleum petrolei TaxID=76116 RepID=A0ABX1MJJ9_9RHOO|nr:polysaccharide deacetylase family protein [Aromatoleum petrolei]
MYHRVGEARDAQEARYAISAANFAAHMHSAAQAGYRAIGIDAFIEWLQGERSLPEGALLITFDDGFRGVREHALPVLEQLGWPFTVFLVSDQIGGENVWTRGTNPHADTYPLLGADEIRDMQKRGCSFQSHSRSHVRLPTLDDGALLEELRGSRERLSTLLDDDVRYLAYPFGQADERVEAATHSAGYTAAFATQPGFNRPEVNRYRIRRLDVFGTDTAAMLLRKIRLGSNDGSLGNMLGYRLRRVANRLAGTAR